MSKKKRIIHLRDHRRDEIQRINTENREFIGRENSGATEKETVLKQLEIEAKTRTSNSNNELDRKQDRLASLRRISNEE